MGGSTGRFPTGLRFLDKQLNGGLKAGGVLALTSPPQSQVELLFQEFARERPLLYVSLLSPDEAELRRIVDPSGDDAVEVTVAYQDPETVLADPESFAAGLPDDSYVLIDAVNPIERSSPDTYLRFLNAVKERMRQGNSFAVVQRPERRGPRERCTRRPPLSPGRAQAREPVADAEARGSRLGRPGVDGPLRDLDRPPDHEVPGEPDPGRASPARTLRSGAHRHEPDDRVSSSSAAASFSSSAALVAFQSTFSTWMSHTKP